MTDSADAPSLCLDSNAAYTYAIYPFLHAMEGKDRAACLKQLEGRWQHAWLRLSDRDLREAWDDTRFTVPPLRRVLFPETTLLSQAESVIPTVGSSETSCSPHPLPPLPRRGRGGTRRAAHAFNSPLPRRGRGAGGEGENRRRAAYEGSVSLEAPIDISYADFQTLNQRLKEPLSVLDRRLGAPDESVRRLTLKAEALSAYQSISIAAWFPSKGRNPKTGEETTEWRLGTPYPMSIEHIDVWLFPQRVGFLVLKLRLRIDSPTVEQYVSWLYYLSQVLPRTSSWKLPMWIYEQKQLEAHALIDELLEGLTDPSDPETYEFGQAYGRNFHLYSYASLTRETAALAETPDALFGTRFRRALYELATCTLTKDPNYVPSAETLQTMHQQNWLALWANWESLALQDHVFYLAKNHLGFLRRNVENDYLNLYLLTLYQKTRLRLLASELQVLQTESRPPLIKAERLRQQFVEFRNHYWFEEASIRPQGNAIYRRYQQGLDSRPLYDEVKSELDELEEYYREQTSKRIGKAINVLTFIGVPAGVAAELFGGALELPVQIGAFSVFALMVFSVWLGLQREWIVYRWRALRAFLSAPFKGQLAQKPCPAQNGAEGNPQSTSGEAGGHDTR